MLQCLKYEQVDIKLRNRAKKDFILTKCRKWNSSTVKPILNVKGHRQKSTLRVNEENINLNI